MELIGITEALINETTIPDLATLQLIKNNFRSKFPQLMTNVLKIAI
jgi:hypothetical protein